MVGRRGCCSSRSPCGSSRGPSEPVVPLRLFSNRTTALAILASLAVGMAMFGGAVFLGQYFQIGRGYTPDRGRPAHHPDDGRRPDLLDRPGRLVTRTGRSSRTSSSGALVLVAGFALSAHRPRHPAGPSAVGMLAGRHRRRHDHAEPGARRAEHRRAAGPRRGQLGGPFFRSLGGTIGVSVLGAVLAHRVKRLIAAAWPRPASRPRLGRRRRPADMDTLPAAPAVVRDAYGDAAGHIFLTSAPIGLLALVAVLLLRTCRCAVSERRPGSPPGRRVITAAANRPVPACSEPA